MVDALVTTASELSLDATRGLIRSAWDVHPELSVYVVSTRKVPELDLPVTVLAVSEFETEQGVAASATLDPDNQGVFALPFALERVLQQHPSAVYLSPGCLVTNSLGALDTELSSSSLALVSPFLAHERFSTTPHLVSLSRRTDLVSTRMIGLRRDAKDHLDAWQRTMVESFFDPWQRRPSELMSGLTGMFLGADNVGVVQEDLLTTWVDFAAIESGRAWGRSPAVVLCDELWELAREAARLEGNDIEVAWQLLTDRVHDSRPLEPLVSLINESVSAWPVDEEAFTLFHWFASEVRRAADPTGVKWAVGEDDAFHEWLFETNVNGLTRLAHLYWQFRSELRDDFPAPKLDPAPLRRWNDRRALAEFGMDLFDPKCAPRKPTEEEILRGRWERLANAVLWRLNVMKGLAPGYAAREEAKDDPGKRRGLAPPRRVEVHRAPPLYGHSVRSLSLIGCFRAESGLGQASRASLGALRRLSRDFSYIDTSEEYPSRNAVDPGLEGETFGAFGDVNLVHSNADELLTLSNRVFRNRLAGRFNVGMWFWEAADLPARSRPAFEVMDELWLASSYLADVFGQYGRVPVEVIGLAADLPSAPEVSREDFGLSDDEFVFLFVYDALSSHGRKNPEKALEAFIKAFAPTFTGVRFVLKVSNLNKFPASQARLHRMASGCPAITLIDSYWPRHRVLGLMAVADVYVSLHAAEGYGLTLLEAMALGSPVVCTGYSGNMDFTSNDNSWLVDYRLIATDEQTGPYPAGSIWASPNVDSTAELMRAAYNNPAEVERKRQRAMVDARETASLERYAARLDAQLRRVL
ncbi:MAG: glycosyltransferase family 4 protein [Actinomycetota bacterium]|nr:glycosyltransferase family 4 protein [Actinomycetota bacterium]